MRISLLLALAALLTLSGCSQRPEDQLFIWLAKGQLLEQCGDDADCRQRIETRLERCVPQSQLREKALNHPEDRDQALQAFYEDLFACLFRETPV